MLYVPLATNYAEYQSRSPCRKIEIQASKGLAAIDFLQYISSNQATMVHDRSTNARKRRCALVVTQNPVKEAGS